MQNGEFKFLIDGVDQNAASDYLMNGLWKSVTREISEGFHKMQWIYSKYINLEDDSDAMEDLAAEIEYVLVRGTSYAPKECSKCHQGVPNFE